MVERSSPSVSGPGGVRTSGVDLSGLAHGARAVVPVALDSGAGAVAQLVRAADS